VKKIINRQWKTMAVADGEANSGFGIREGRFDRVELIQTNSKENV
jgi:hypothetical protein